MKALITVAKKLDSLLTHIAILGMALSRRSAHPIHPKHLFDEERNTLLKEVLKEGVSFLDVGSGTGTDCLTALFSGAKTIWGLEKDSTLVTIAEKRIREVQSNNAVINFITVDLECNALPFPAHTFDVVNFTNVLEHLSNRHALLIELRRVLKADGLMVVSAPNCETPWKRLQRKYGVDSRDDIDHKIEYTEASLCAEFEEAGYEIVSKLHPIVPSWPFDGAMALLAVISPNLYRLTQRFKVRLVHRKPWHTVAWTFLVKSRCGSNSI